MAVSLDIAYSGTSATKIYGVQAKVTNQKIVFVATSRSLNLVDREIATVVRGTQSFTRVGFADDGVATRAEIWYLDGPVVDAVDIDITYTGVGPDYTANAAYILDGTLVGTAESFATTAAASGANPSLTLATTSGAFVVDAASFDGIVDGGWSVGVGQELLYTYQSFSLPNRFRRTSSYRVDPPAASVTMSATNTSTGRSMIAASFRAFDSGLKAIPVASTEVDYEQTLIMSPLAWVKGVLGFPIWDSGTGFMVAWRNLQAPAAVAVPILDDAQSTFEGDWAISGNLTKTLDGATFSASGTHVAPTISGSFAKTLDSATFLPSGTNAAPVISGSLAKTLDGVGFSASGSHVAPTISGSLSKTLDGATSSITGSHVAPTVSGSFAQTLDNVGFSSSGTYSAPIFNGDLTNTLSNATLSSQGDHVAPTISGSLVSNLGDSLYSCVSTNVAPTISGSISTTLASVGTPSPSSLSPDVWFDVALGGSSSGIYDSSRNNVSQLAFGPSANAPTLLKDVSPSVRFTGTSSYIAGSATTALDSATQFDYRIAIAMADWTPSGNMVLLSKGLSSAVSGHSTLQVLTTGSLRLTWSDGVAAASPTSTVATGFADGSLWAVRATWDKASGQVKFFTKATTYAAASSDVASNSGWTQLGSTLTNNTRSVQAITTGFGIGSYFNGSNLSLAGTFVAAARMGSVIDGAPSITFDAGSCGQTGYVDPVSGSTYSIARSTSGIKTAVVARPTILVGTDDYADSVAGVPSATASDSFTIASLVRPWATQAAGNVIATTRTGASTNGVQVEMAGNNSARVVISDGTTSITTASVTISIGVRNLIGAIVTPTTVRAFSVTPSAVNLGATSSRTGANETGGQLRFALSALGTAGTDLDAESEMPIAAFASALSSAELSLIYSYYNGSPASGLVQFDGSISAALGDATTSFSGSEVFEASIASSIEDSQFTSTGTEDIGGQSSAVLGQVLLNSSGFEVLSGEISPAELLLIFYGEPSASGLMQLNGSVAAVLGDAVISSSGLEEFRAVLAAIIQGLDLDSTGSEEIAGQSSVAIDSASLLSSGSETFSGDIHADAPGADLSSAGAESFDGTSSLNLEDASFSSSGFFAVDGVATVQLGDAAISASGSHVAPTNPGSLQSQLQGVQATSSGGLTFSGEIQRQLEAAASSFSALEAVIGVLGIQLGGVYGLVNGSWFFISEPGATINAVDLLQAFLSAKEESSIKIIVSDAPSRTVDSAQESSVIIEAVDFPSRLLIAANQN